MVSDSYDIIIISTPKILALRNRVHMINFISSDRCLLSTFIVN